MYGEKRLNTDVAERKRILKSACGNRGKYPSYFDGPEVRVRRQKVLARDKEAAMHIFDMCVDEQESMEDTAEDLMDLEDDYQFGLTGVNKVYENARMHDVKNKLILRTLNKQKQSAERLEYLKDIAISPGKQMRNNPLTKSAEFLV